MRQALLIFVDGLGMGSEDPEENPVHSGACPNLARLLRERAVAVDPTMGVAGLPQSATGTGAILTGINTAQFMKRHMEGFPRRRLKELIQKHNIFWQLASRGLCSTFANGYYVDDVSEVEQGRFQSATTVAALAAFGRVRGKAMLASNEAVYHDLTREALRARGYGGPLVSPVEAATHLAAISRAYHFTLFEYFQTDRAGHEGETDRVRRVLSLLDGFIAALVPQLAEAGILLVLTSDHGNIEDGRGCTHTGNPVPFAAVGPGEDRLRARVRSITDVTPALLGWLAGEG